MSEQPRRVEPPASPEKSMQRYMTPPRARILASVASQDLGVLHPDSPGKSFDKSQIVEGLANEENRMNFDPLARMSSESRSKHYETDDRSFDQQFHSWEQKTQRWINWAYTKNSDFKEALSALGIDNTNQEAAKIFYETYLENVPEGASTEERAQLTKFQSDKQINDGLMYFSSDILKASQKDGVVDMAQVDKLLVDLRPLLNTFGTVDEVAERVRDYVTAEALLIQEDHGSVAEAVLESLDGELSGAEKNSMRVLAYHAGIPSAHAGRAPGEDRQRPPLAEGVAAAAGALAGAALAEKAEESDSDEAPVAPIEPPTTEAKEPEKADTEPGVNEPEPAPQSPAEEEKPTLDPGKEFLSNTDRVLTDDELQVAVDYFGVPSEKRDEIRHTLESTTHQGNVVFINVVRELATLLSDETAKTELRDAAGKANENIKLRLEKLGIADEETQDMLSDGEWYFSKVAEEKFFAEHHEVKQSLLGNDILPSVDPTAYYLKKDLSLDSHEWQDSQDAEMKILYGILGGVVLHQRGDKESGEYAQEILSKLNDTLSEEDRSHIEEIFEFSDSSVPPDAYENLGGIIWENLPEGSETSAADGEPTGGTEVQREEGTVDEVIAASDGGVSNDAEGEQSTIAGDEAASEVTLSGDAEETARENVGDEQTNEVVDAERTSADEIPTTDEVEATADATSGETEQEVTNNDVVESDIPATAEEGEEPVRTIDVSTTNTDNDTDVVNNGGDEQGTAEEQEAQEDGDGTPPQTPPPPVIRQ